MDTRLLLDRGGAMHLLLRRLFYGKLESMIGENCANKVRKQKGSPFHYAEPNCRAGFKDGRPGRKGSGFN